MLFVGLTGGIASGKSLVAAVLDRLGAVILDADRMVRELTEPEEPAWEEIVKHFGEGILLPDRQIDRKQLGEIVFQSEKERSWLNACIHPRVFSSYEAQVQRLRRGPADRVIVFDAALLFETGYHRMMDRIVVVFAAPEQQLTRLMLRDGLTREQAALRISSQMPLDRKRSMADYVIENTSDREETERQTRLLFHTLKHEAEQCS